MKELLKEAVFSYERVTGLEGFREIQINVTLTLLMDNGISNY